MDRGKIHIVYDTTWLLKGDFESRSKWYQTMWQMGVFSVNDILRNEGMNTIGADGDKRFVPLNFTTLQKAGTEEAARAFMDSDEYKAFSSAMKKIEKMNGHHTLI